MVFLMDIHQQNLTILLVSYRSNYKRRIPMIA